MTAETQEQQQQQVQTPLQRLEAQAEILWKAIRTPLSNEAAKLETDAANLIHPLAKELGMVVHLGQTAGVLSNIADMVETEALKVVLPVFIKAVNDVEAAVQSGSPVTLSALGAQFVADMAGVMPTLELDAVQAASALYQKLVATVISKAASAATPAVSANIAQAAPGLTQN